MRSAKGVPPSARPLNLYRILKVLAAQAPGTNTRATAMTAKVVPRMNQNFLCRMELSSLTDVGENKVENWRLSMVSNRGMVRAVWPREHLDARAYLPSEKKK